MNLVKDGEQVILKMSWAEWSQLRSWGFQLQEVAPQDEEPDGRIFGRPVMEDSEPTCVTLELLDRIAALESKVSWIQESAGEAQNEIERRVAGLEGHTTEMGFEALIGRVRRLESQTQFETSEDDARIKALERQIVDIEGHVVKLAMNLSEVTDRLDTYGVPVVGRPKDVSPIEFLKRARGIEKQTLNTAEDRVRRYMAGHWSHASVEGVVAALKGTQTDDPAAGGVVPRITDHAFRYSALDRRHCAYRGDPEDEKCGRLRSEHSHYQTQPSRA